MTVDLKDPKSRLSYALAMNIADSVRRMPVELDYQLLGTALADLFAGGTPQLAESEFHAAMQELQTRLQSAAREAQSRAGTANQEAEKRFMEENRQRSGVKETASGLQYEELRPGSGATPRPEDVVRVHYEGRLLDGRVFDSSVQRGEPAEFPVNQVIAGWTEALGLMKVGAKMRLFIPSRLAYGARGAGELIGPHSALIFDVELLDIVR